MSIESNMNRIEQNVENALTAISEYGVEIAPNTNSDQLGNLIRAIPKANIVQTTGISTSNIMSQKAVTDAITVARILSEEEMASIAEMVNNATIIQAPKYVASVDEMTDTNKVYVMAGTGHIWSYMNTSTEQEVTVTDKIVGSADNPYQVGRLSSSGTVSNDVSTHVVTPYIDLTQAKYAGKTIQLHLDGNRYVTESNETYIMSALFKADKSVLNGRSATCLDKNYGILTSISNLSAAINGTTSATLTITVPPSWSGTPIGYMRFCGLGTEATSNVYITYKAMQAVSGGQWVDTGLVYNLTEADKKQMAEDVAAMIDTQLLGLIGSGEVTV